VRNGKTTMQTQATTAPRQPATVSLVDKILPPMTIIFGLALTAVWIFLLGYGLINLIEIVS